MISPFSTAPAPHAEREFPIHDLLARRWSPRAFDPARRITDAEVGQLFEAVRWAPSSFNGQPWRYFFARKDAEPSGFEDLLEILNPQNQSWAEGASMLILGIAKTSVEGRNAPNRYAAYDLGAANFALTVQAQALDLFVHQMAGFDRELASSQFGLPSDYEPVVVMAVGALGDPALLSEALRAREVPQKPRLPQAAFVERLD